MSDIITHFQIIHHVNDYLSSLIIFHFSLNHWLTWHASPSFLPSPLSPSHPSSLPSPQSLPLLLFLLTYHILLLFHFSLSPAPPFLNFLLFLHTYSIPTSLTSPHHNFYNSFFQ